MESSYTGNGHADATPQNEEKRSALSRRGFLGQCASIIQGVTIVGVIAPLASACSDSTSGPNQPTTGDVEFDVSGLTQNGQGMLTDSSGSDGFPVLIVRLGPDQYTALSTRCTHQSCEVNLPQGNEISCPCHGSRYGLDGTLIQGPAENPLKSYQLTYDASARTVTVTIT